MATAMKILDKAEWFMITMKWRRIAEWKALNSDGLGLLKYTLYHHHSLKSRDLGRELERAIPPCVEKKNRMAVAC